MAVAGALRRSSVGVFGEDAAGLAFHEDGYVGPNREGAEGLAGFGDRGLDLVGCVAIAEGGLELLGDAPDGGVLVEVDRHGSP